MTAARSLLRVSCVALGLAACVPGPPAVPMTPSAPVVQETGALDLATLHDGEVALGFVTRALYLGSDGGARGARFVHSRTGFVFDYVRLESAPQALVYVTTYPTGDGGEPHTQEHLVLGKGNKGRWLGNFDQATFSETGAFTAHHQTAYGFHTSAGERTFWDVLATNLDALLHPDYSDEEIRREVWHFGVATQPNGALVLDEKGTVYNEMVTQLESPDTRAWTEMSRLLYGVGHPLANVSGGTPEGIRKLTPEIIRAFHREHYQLGNMTMVGAFPSSMALAGVLAHVGGALDALASPAPPPLPALSDATLPTVHGAASGTNLVVEYPFGSADHPGPALLAWPATRNLSIDERIGLQSFLDAFASGPGSILYRALIDGSSRVLDVGATGVSGWVRRDLGQPVYVSLDGVSSASATEASMSAVKNAIYAELLRIAAWPDGSKELLLFNEQVKARIVDARRQAEKWLDTPPNFGGRVRGVDWLGVIDDLGQTPGFQKSLTYEPSFEAALRLLDPHKNRWRDLIRAWGLLELPYAVVTRPSPALQKNLDHERDERRASAMAYLLARLGTNDREVALRQRLAEITLASEETARAEATVPMRPLALDPPMSQDDALSWKLETRGGASRVTATVDTMKSATVGIHLSLEAVTDDLLPWLGVLPPLLEDAGVLHEGVRVDYGAARDRLRREVLALKVSFSTNARSGRAELLVEASGNSETETRRALGWAKDFLVTPDWRKENLPRLRDVLDAELLSLHATMTHREEYWLKGLAEAYQHRENPLLLHTRSPLTRAHDAFLTSWQLQGGDGAAGVEPFLRGLAGAGARLDRESLAKLASALAAPMVTGSRVEPKLRPFVDRARSLPSSAEPRVRKAGRDLGLLLGDLPDGSLTADWAALCKEMADSVARPPLEGLLALEKTLALVRHAGHARVWVVGSAPHLAAVASDIDRTLLSLYTGTAPPAEHRRHEPITERVQARGGGVISSFVALVNPNTAGSALVASAPSLGYDETREDRLVDFLAVNVFGGQGTQSFYKRIWGSGLAYSGYLENSPSRGRELFYTDRCADLPALLGFVDTEVRTRAEDPRFVDYAVAAAFGSRVADDFEARARAMAADLADGNPPEKVRAFRKRLLALRQSPDLSRRMANRFVPAMSAVLPSLLPASPLPAEAAAFAVAPLPRIDDYEGALRRTRADTRVTRLWPRDFWDPIPGR